MSTNINSTEQIVEINAGDQITNINLVSQSTTQVVSGEQVVTVDVNAGTIPAAWGSITGTLSNQTDLQNALNAKQNNITLSTTGTTGVATLVGTTLNIPNYVTSTKQTEWDSAYNDKITSAEVSGTTTKTLTLNQQDGGTITASWSDFDTAPVTSVFGRTGNVVATEGDYNIGQMGDVTITSASNGQVLKYNGTAWVNAADASGLTSVGLAMPSAFAVSGSPLTSNGTITVTGAGTTSQYVRGDGSLANFPSTSNEAKTLIREVYNSTGATLTKGTVVYIIGGQGNLPTVDKALAIGDATSAQTFGIVQSDITNMNNGFVVVAGGIDNIDTQAFPVGTALYLSPTTAGAFTSTKPYAPDHMVYLGVIVRSHPTQGVIEVKIQNGVELYEIHDVSARFPVNNDGIFYNSTTEVWENKSIAGVLGYTPEQPLTFSSPLVRTTNTISIPAATGSVNGYLSSTDWTTFNNKQNALTNPVTGTGTTNTLPKFTSASTISNSNITDTGSLITLGSNSTVIGDFTVSKNDRANGALLRLTNSFDGTGWIAGDIIGSLEFYSSDASAIGTRGAIKSISEAGANFSSKTGLSFETYSTTLNQRMYLSGDGALGLGTSSLTGYNLRVAKTITGATNSYGVTSEGVVQSDVTSTANYFLSAASTQATTFTLSSIFHYRAQQGTIGAGSTVTNQWGFAVDSNLIGATNNYGFRGAIPSGTNRWNIYMNGTAANYLAGQLLIGTTTTSAFALDVNGTARVSGELTVNTVNIGLGGGAISTNTRVGVTALGGNTSGVNNAAFGYFSMLVNTTGSTNTALGVRTLQQNSSGSNNIAIGERAMQLNDTGSENTAIGNTALLNITASNQNVAIGLAAGRYITGLGANTICSNSIFIGWRAKAQADNQTNQIVIGDNATGLGSNTTVIGNSSTTAATIFGALTASSFIPTSSTIPTNGMYLSGTNTLGFATNGTLDMVISEAGSVGIGTTSLTGYSLVVGKNITGATTSYGAAQTGAVQSGVTTTAFGYYNESNTAASSFTLTNYIGYFATQGTIGATSAVTNQYGFFVGANLTGATNNYGFYGNIASGTNRWNLYMNGTANNYMAGKLGIGSTALTDTNFYLNRSLTGGTVAIGQRIEGEIQSDVTSQAIGLRVFLSTAATAFTVGTVWGIRVANTSLRSGSTITEQYGFGVGDLTSGGTNGAYESRVSAGANKWGLYFSGTANNYMAGSLGIGSTSLTGINFRVFKNVTGATTAYNALIQGAVQSDVTSQANNITSELSTQAAAFTLPTFTHFRAAQSTIGAGSTVTTQAGFWANSNMIGATNNYGFYGEIPSGTNRWNLYMAGTAANYLAGGLSIGTTSPNASAKVQVDSTTQGFLPPRMTTTQKNAIGTPAAGLMVYDTTLNQMSYYNGTTWINF